MGSSIVCCANCSTIIAEYKWGECNLRLTKCICTSTVVKYKFEVVVLGYLHFMLLYTYKVKPPQLQ